jgi:hypothetical protein
VRLALRSYLFIESRCEPESADVAALLDLTTELADAGHQVMLFLVQNAVLGSCTNARLATLVQRGGVVVADELSLRLRRVRADALVPGVRLGGAEQLVSALMAPGVVPLWH